MTSYAGCCEIVSDLSALAGRALLLQWRRRSVVVRPCLLNPLSALPYVVSTVSMGLKVIDRTGSWLKLLPEARAMQP